MRELSKGNVAVVKGAILAGCRAFYGYPITPASEITEAAALYLPQVGGVFLQAESEVAAINMVYGAASAGVRVMTASSGPGLSLMQEGISHLAGAELPCVIVDVVRGGPGLGNIAPEQSDYFALVKGGGHGNYRNFVLAPASVQEMSDLTQLAFDLADRYRNPAIVLSDGFIGQMMESMELKALPYEVPDKPCLDTELLRRLFLAIPAAELRGKPFGVKRVAHYGACWAVFPRRQCGEVSFLLRKWDERGANWPLARAVYRVAG